MRGPRGRSWATAVPVSPDARLVAGPGQIGDRLARPLQVGEGPRWRSITMADATAESYPKLRQVLGEDGFKELARLIRTTYEANEQRRRRETDEAVRGVKGSVDARTGS